MVPHVVVVLLGFVLFVRVGTDPLAPAVLPIADNTLEPAGVLADLLEVVAEPAQVPEVALEFGRDVGADDVAVEDALLAVLLLERRPPPLPVHVEHLARLELLAEARFEELFAFLLELLLHEVEVDS